MALVTDPVTMGGTSSMILLRGADLLHPAPACSPSSPLTAWLCHPSGSLGGSGICPALLSESGQRREQTKDEQHSWSCWKLHAVRCCFRARRALLFRRESLSCRPVSLALRAPLSLLLAIIFKALLQNSFCFLVLLSVVLAGVSAADHTSSLLAVATKHGHFGDLPRCPHSFECPMTGEPSQSTWTPGQQRRG